MAELDDDEDEFSTDETTSLAMIRREAGGDANSCAITLLCMIEATAHELTPGQRRWLANALAVVARDMSAPAVRR